MTKQNKPVQVFEGDGVCQDLQPPNTLLIDIMKDSKSMKLKPVMEGYILERAWLESWEWEYATGNEEPISAVIVAQEIRRVGQ